MTGGSTIVDFWRDEPIATESQAQSDDILLLKQAVREMEAEQVLLKQQADGLQQQKTTVQATLQRTQKELSQVVNRLKN